MHILAFGHIYTLGSINWSSRGPSTIVLLYIYPDTALQSSLFHMMNAFAFDHIYILGSISSSCQEASVKEVVLQYTYPDTALQLSWPLVMLLIITPLWSDGWTKIGALYDTYFSGYCNWQICCFIALWWCARSYLHHSGSDLWPPIEYLGHCEIFIPITIIIFAQYDE